VVAIEVAGRRPRSIREPYRPERRTLETVVHEWELTLDLDEVETGVAQLRLHLSELLEDEEQAADAEAVVPPKAWAGLMGTCRR